MIIKKSLRVRILKITPLLFLAVVGCLSALLTANSPQVKADWATAGWSEISAGEGHTCGVSSGKAYCWGSENVGQLGNGIVADSGNYYPTPVDTSGVLKNKTVTEISAGAYFTCAIADGKAYCWGHNSDGQLGDGTTNDSNIPVAVNDSGVLSGKTVESISAGTYHTCAIADGNAYCWGKNQKGQLGDGTTNNSLIPVATDTSGVLAGKTITKISAAIDYADGMGHTCAIADGKAYCWGDNSIGQIGTNNTQSVYLSPAAVDTTGLLSGKTATDVAVNTQSSCALADGKPYCWGSQGGGLAGEGSSGGNTYSPVATDTTGVLNGKTATSISAGDGAACVIANAKAYCWGLNNTGKVGDGTLENALVPVEVNTQTGLGTQTIQSISVSTWDTCAVAGTDAYCWGQNSLGSIGNGPNNSPNNNYITSPALVIPRPAPTISNMSATIGSIGGGESLEISGDNFDNPIVTIGGNIATITSSYPQDIQVTVPASSSPGVVDVTITNSDGKSVTYNQSYQYVAPGQPVILSVYGAEDTAYGGGTLSIHGYNFENPTVSIGGNVAVVNSSSSSDLQVSIPASAVTGSVDVKVINQNGLNAVKSNAFQYVATKQLSNRFKNTFGGTGSGDGQFNWLEGIAFDNSGLIYVTDNGNNRVEVFNPDGSYVRQFGTSGLGAGQIDYATAIKIGPDGNVYVLDPGILKVSVFTKLGTYLRQIDVSKAGYPEGMAFNSKGDMYITDCGAESTLKVYKADGTYIRNIGTDGSGEGQLNCSYAVEIDSNDNVYVADASNYRIQEFDKNDNFVKKFGSQGIGEGQLGWVEGLTIDKLGNILVADSDNNRIQVFTNEGAYLGQIGRIGTGSGQFSYPNSIAIDQNGDLYVTDASNNRVQIFEGIQQASAPASVPVSKPVASVPVLNSKSKITDDSSAATEATNKAELEQSITINGETPLTGDSTIPKRPTFTGVAAPFAEVVITIHSDPVVCRTTADAEGKWSCTLDRDLPAGSHHVTIELTNRDGTKTTLGPYAVEVKGGDTVGSDSSFVTEKNPSTDAKKDSKNPSYLYIVIAVIAVLGIIGAAVLKRSRNHSFDA